MRFQLFRLVADDSFFVSCSRGQIDLTRKSGSLDMFIYIKQETGAGDFYECAVEKINFFCFIHNHLQGFGIVKTNRGVEGSVFGDLARSQKFDIGRNVTSILTLGKMLCLRKFLTGKKHVI